MQMFLTRVGLFCNFWITDKGTFFDIAEFPKNNPKGKKVCANKEPTKIYSIDFIMY